MTVQLFLERTFEESLTREGVLAGSRRIDWCLDLHRVRWRSSFLAADGRTMICWFSAADRESVRLALLEARADLARLWSGTVHASAHAVTPNVVVERSFRDPVRYEDIDALGRAKPWCYEAHGARHAYSFFSLDAKRMLCFYAAPDAEAMRIVQRETAMPADAVWAGALVTPDG